MIDRVPGDCLPINSSVFHFKAQVQSIPVTIRLSRDYISWSEDENLWSILYQKEIVGSSIELQDSNTNEKKSSVVVHAWCSSKRNQPLSNSTDSDKWNLLLIGTVIYTQISRLINILMNQENCLIHVEQRFEFLADKQSGFVSNRLQAKRLHRLLLHICVQSELESQKALAQAAQSQTYIPDLPSKRKILCIVNPQAGSKQGIRVFNQLRPMIEASRDLIDLDFQITTHSKHAIEIVKGDIEEYSVIACLGGDGTPHEVINGILARPNGEQLLKQISLALIPAGTGNGLTASLGIKTFQDAFLRIVHGNKMDIDVLQITQENNPTFGNVYSLLQVSFGMMSDVDFESEKFRWLGDLRFTLVAVYRLLFMREYPVKINLFAKSMKRVDSNNQVYWEDINQPIEIDSPTVWCGGLNASWMASEFQCAPTAKLNDGLIHFINAPRWQKFSMFLFFFAMSSGQHVKSKEFLMATTKSFSIKAPEYKGVPSRLDVDGEAICTLPNETITVSVIPGLCKILA